VDASPSLAASSTDRKSLCGCDAAAARAATMPSIILRSSPFTRVISRSAEPGTRKSACRNGFCRKGTNVPTMVESDPDRSILSDVVEWMCMSMNSDDAVAAAPPPSTPFVSSSPSAACFLDRPKSAPNAACPMTSVVRLTAKSEKTTSSPSSRFVAARWMHDSMAGISPARCDGW